MNNKTNTSVPLLLWPVCAIWRLLTLILNVVGRLVCGLLGISLMITGVAVTMSILAAPVGIPLAAVGFLLLTRSLF